MEPRTISKPTLADLLRDIRPSVSVVQWAYRVDYGLGVRPRLHTVNKARRCQCVLGTECPAVLAVAEYLRAGGERAPDSPFDFWPSVPEACPICGGLTESDPGLFSREHGQGWRCAQTGGLCCWAARAVPLVAARSARPYVIPPAGKETNNPQAGPSAESFQAALDSLRGWLAELAARNWQATAEVAPGTTAAEMAVARERARQRREAWAAEGYIPDA